MFLLVDFSALRSSFSEAYLWCCLLNGVFFHFQTISAYVLMDFISPVTHRLKKLEMRFFWGGRLL